MLSGIEISNFFVSDHLKSSVLIRIWNSYSRHTLHTSFKKKLVYKKLVLGRPSR